MGLHTYKFMHLCMYLCPVGFLPVIWIREFLKKNPDLVSTLVAFYLYLATYLLILQDFCGFHEDLFLSSFFSKGFGLLKVWMINVKVW